MAVRLEHLDVRADDRLSRVEVVADVALDDLATVPFVAREVADLLQQRAAALGRSVVVDQVHRVSDTRVDGGGVVEVEPADSLITVRVAQLLTQ